MLMQSPQFGLPAVRRFPCLWPRQSSSRTRSTKGFVRDHFSPVMALDGQWSRQRVQPPQKQCSTGASGRSGASVSTVASEMRGPWSALIRSPFFPTQPMPAEVAAILWLKSE